MVLIIEYGTENNKIDVTNFVLLESNKKNNLYIIPSCDNKRVLMFNNIDPAYGIIKNIFIRNETNSRVFNSIENIYIDSISNEFYSDFDLNLPEKIKNNLPNYEAVQELIKIHNNINLKYGDLHEEYPEQVMIVKYIKGNEKILEIGGNIGRSSLIASYILNNNNNNNLVTLECDSEICEKLKENKEINNRNFFIENSALSKRKLIQKGWNTIVSDTILPGYKCVNIISFEELQLKYSIIFDTLILDCEGAFYFILNDMPEVLTNIKLIIIENDYTDINHKMYVDNELKKKGFEVVYTESGYCGVSPQNFYEVWQK